MTPDEIIAVVTAFKEGKRIQWRFCGSQDWHRCEDPMWDFFKQEYRIAPEPMEVWINTYPTDERGPCAYTDRETAARYCGAGGVTKKFREVMEDGE